LIPFILFEFIKIEGKFEEKPAFESKKISSVTGPI